MRLRVILVVLLLGVTAAAAPPGAAKAPRRATAAPAGAAKAPRRATAATDWWAYHGNRTRSGQDKNMPTYRGGLHVIRRIRLDGAVYAAPIVAKGLTIVATENDTVYAFNARNQLVWKHHLGTPAPQSALPCGDIFPLGITGTPVYWGPAGLIYLATEFANPVRHRLFALRVNNGAIASNRNLDFSGVETRAMQERGALTITGGRVWVPFGGLAGDCAAYKGRVVGWPLTGRGAAVRYTVPTQREAGIWTPPGPTVGPSGNLLVSVGNGASTTRGHYDHSDSVLRLGTKARLIDSFSPTSWPSDNANDLDLGSQGPAVVAGKWVFAAGKSGTAYVLSLKHLRGVGGQVSSSGLCASFGGTAVVNNVVYVPCTDGLRAVRIDNAGRMHVLWHAASSITGSPVVGGGVVWTLDTGSGVLHGLGPTHGATRASVSVGSVTRFATPALSGRRILIGTTSGLTILGY